MSYAQEQRSPTRHIVGFTLVVVFHLLLIYALVTGLGRNIVDVIKQPLETKIIKDTKPPPPEAPPPPPPQLAAPPPPYVPPPDIQIQQPPQSNAITAVTREAPPTTTLAPTPPPAVKAAVPDQDVSARPISGGPLVYPSDMQEEEREGRVTVTCDVDASGHTSNCETGNVVGGPSFARAAVRYAEGNRYSPKIQNGQPVPWRKSWVITFRLND